MDLKPGKKWECSKCSTTFKTNYDLTRHIVMHDPDAKVKCETCGTIFKTTGALRFHTWSVHSNRKRPSCDTCHRVYFTSAGLRRHIETVHSTIKRPRFPCTVPGCEKTYLAKDALTIHVNTEHAENPARFPCTLCGKEFKTRAHLESHTPIHTTEKPYNCSKCGKSFAHKAKMKSHEKTHLEKSARDVSKCHLCPQTFLTRNGLQGHIRVVHENQRNYPCPFCDKKFSFSSGLKRHVEARHATNKALKIHSCDKCKYRSHTKFNLDLHRRRHKGMRHGCYFCGKRFVTFHELVQHCKVHTLES
ncbi:zinc finger protein 25 [Folsomia candida]|uniref:zinc finger protein 25 n=1 Tax=Folsomia candida TaxID=158441 RepID=UPI000B905D2C|nr:zinc finger protein 25 [Folsomia candida]